MRVICKHFGRVLFLLTSWKVLIVSNSFKKNTTPTYPFPLSHCTPVLTFPFSRKEISKQSFFQFQTLIPINSVLLSILVCRGFPSKFPRFVAVHYLFGYSSMLKDQWDRQRAARLDQCWDKVVHHLCQWLIRLSHLLKVSSSFLSALILKAIIFEENLSTSLGFCKDPYSNEHSFTIYFKELLIL